MTVTVWLNGAFVEAADAKISVFDAGLQHGVGLFETILVSRGECIMLDAHLARLALAARDLGLTTSLRQAPLAQAVRSVVKKSGLDRARVRVTITGGDLNMRSATPGAQHDPTLLVVAQPAPTYPEQLFHKGAQVVVAALRVNPLDPFAGRKTINYWPRLRALQLAASAGADETLVMQVTDHLASGGVSNVFVVKDGALHTPIAQGEEAEEGADLPSPVLPGVTRNFIVEAARLLGAGVSKRMLSLDDALDADEVFLTNSMWGVLPVTRIERDVVGTAKPGDLTRQLLERWRDRCEGEHAA